MFEEFFGTRRRSREGPQPGADLRLDLEIDFEEAVFGVQREITVPTLEECASCGGRGMEPGSSQENCRHCGGRGVVVTSSGFFQVRQTCPVCGGAGRVITKPCRTCRGSGRVKARQRLTLRIPAGVETGSRLRVGGRGEAGARGGPPGDLYVVLHVRPHELFHREGNDLICEVPIPADVAALGGEVAVPTLDGNSTLRIEPGTGTGRVFRLRGQGVPSVDGRGRGDLHVRVVVEVPRDLNARQRKALREFQAAGHPDNYPLCREFAERARKFANRRRTATEPEERERS